MNTRGITKPTGFYQRMHNGFIESSNVAETVIQRPQHHHTPALHRFVASLNYSIVCILRRKKTQIVRGKIRIGADLARYLKEHFGLTGRFSPTDLARLGAADSIRVNEQDVKRVMRFESLIYTKKALSCVDANLRPIRTQAPIYFSYKMACKHSIIDQSQE